MNNWNLQEIPRPAIGGSVQFSYRMHDLDYCRLPGQRGNPPRLPV